MHKKEIAVVIFLIIVLILISFSMSSSTIPISDNDSLALESISGVKYVRGEQNTSENIVIVHSFPTNSILLNGLIEYLSSYFNVYFIDLPGFTTKTPPLEEISIDNYSAYVGRKIGELNLDNYLLAGISFGFPIINNAEVDTSKVRAILAIEPYLNKEYLHFGFAQNFFYSHLLGLISTSSNFEKWIWNNPLADEVLGMLAGQSFERMRTVIKEVDSQTFFKTAEQLLENDKEIKFKKGVPYVLVINNSDGTINATPVIKLFTDNIAENDLKIIYTEIDHYPRDVSKEFFKTQFKAKDIEGILSWLNSRK